MTLYNTILKYEDDRATQGYENIESHRSVSACVPAFLSVESTDDDVSRAKAILDMAYERRGEEIDKESLDNLVKETGGYCTELCGHKVPEEHIVPATRDYLKAKYDFYSKLFTQEGEAESMEDALKGAFSSREELDNYLARIDDAEFRMYSIFALFAPEILHEIEEGHVYMHESRQELRELYSQES